MLLVVALATVITGSAILVSWRAINNGYENFAQKGEEISRHTLFEEWGKQISTTTKLVAEKMAQPAFELNLTDLNRICQIYSDERDVISVLATNDKGMVLAWGGKDKPAYPIGTKFPGFVKSTDGPSHDVNGNKHILKTPIMFAKGSLGTVIMEFSDNAIQKRLEDSLAQSRHAVTMTQKDIISQLLVQSLIAMMIALLIAIFLVRQLFRPLSTIMVGTQKVSKGDLSYRIEPRGDDELADLARSFNKMSENLQRSTVSREYFDHLVQNLPNSLVTLSPELKILSANPAAEKLLGYGAKELLGKPIDFVMPDSEKTASQIKNVFKEKKPLMLETNYLDQNKKSIPVLLSCAFMEGSYPGPPIVLCVAQDITARVKLERMKDDFVSSVSHELRTPLTSIRGSLGLLLGGVAGEFKGKARSLVEIACSNTDRLVRLINDVLDIEKIESGKMKLNLEMLDLVSLARESFDANQGYALKAKTKLEFKTSIEKALVNVDKDRILQVLDNLVSNALKYGSDGKIVTLAMDLIGKKARVSVIDRGKGIPKEFIPNMFEKFSQANVSLARKSTGTGLGLSICKALIERNDGSIGFSSSPNKETVFYFELPVVVFQSQHG